LEQTAAVLDGVDMRDAIAMGVKEDAAGTTLVDVGREKQFDG
jgi:hypothetical protein